MQRTWWPEAGTIIVTEPYCLWLSGMTWVQEILSKFDRAELSHSNATGDPDVNILPRHNQFLCGVKKKKQLCLAQLYVIYKSKRLVLLPDPAWKELNSSVPAQSRGHKQGPKFTKGQYPSKHYGTGPERYWTVAFCTSFRYHSSTVYRYWMAGINTVLDSTILVQVFGIRKKLIQKRYCSIPTVETRYWAILFLYPHPVYSTDPIQKRYSPLQLSTCTVPDSTLCVSVLGWIRYEYNNDLYWYSTQFLLFACIHSLIPTPIHFKMALIIICIINFPAVNCVMWIVYIDR